MHSHATQGPRSPHWECSGNVVGTWPLLLVLPVGAGRALPGAVATLTGFFYVHRLTRSVFMLQELVAGRSSLAPISWTIACGWCLFSVVIEDIK